MPFYHRLGRQPSRPRLVGVVLLYLHSDTENIKKLNQPSLWTLCLCGRNHYGSYRK